VFLHPVVPFDGRAAPIAFELDRSAPRTYIATAQL
jgi:hypothetical protein